MGDQDFAAVLERARGGDAEATAQLVRQYEPEVRRVARRRLGPALRAALESIDLVQSVHRSLLRCLRENRFTITGPQDLVALAVTMVKRKAARKWARLQREREVLQLRALVLSRIKPDRASKLAEELQDLLETLDDSDFQLVKLYLEGHSTVEAARILGLDPDSLRVRRSRLFRKLRASGLEID
jgi:RNA polymerase sigma-70 factor (ECF subfamily)